jgi:hypothetical protein
MNDKKLSFEEEYRIKTRANAKRYYNRVKNDPDFIDKNRRKVKIWSLRKKVKALTK